MNSRLTFLLFTLISFVAACQRPEQPQLRPSAINPFSGLPQVNKIGQITAHTAGQTNGAGQHSFGTSVSVEFHSTDDTKQWSDETVIEAGNVTLGDYVVSPWLNNTYYQLFQHDTLATLLELSASQNLWLQSSQGPVAGASIPVRIIPPVEILSPHHSEVARGENYILKWVPNTLLPATKYVLVQYEPDHRENRDLPNPGTYRVELLQTSDDQIDLSELLSTFPDNAFLQLHVGCGWIDYPQDPNGQVIEVLSIARSSCFVTVNK